MNSQTRIHSLDEITRSTACCVICACSLAIASIVDIWIIRCAAAVVGLCCLALTSVGPLAAGVTQGSTRRRSNPGTWTADEKDDDELSGDPTELVGSLLRQGRYADGWDEYEWRWRTLPHRFEQPEWAGQSLTDETLLVHAEQGLGDAIQ